MMATTGKYRYSVVLRGNEQRLSGAVSIVNTVGRVTKAVFSLSDTEMSFEKQNSYEIPAHGSALVTLDELFPSAPAEQSLFVSVISNHPTRKHIVNWYADESWSIDHFPSRAWNSPSSTPISHMNPIFGAARWGFCYKNQYVEVMMERLACPTRWVNRNGKDFGSILTAA